MISLDAARSVARSISGNAKILEADEARPWLDAVAAALSLVPGAGTIIALARSTLSGAADAVAGVAIPTPWGTLILLGPRAVVDGPTYLSVVAHELVHAEQASAVGSAQAVIDYTQSNIRAFREAEAGGVGLWVRYLLTGHRPAPDEAGVVSSSIYHLDEEHRAFARVVVTTSLASIETAAVPAHPVAAQVLLALRAQAPDAILAREYRE